MSTTNLVPAIQHLVDLFRNSYESQCDTLSIRINCDKEFCVTFSGFCSSTTLEPVFDYCLKNSVMFWLSSSNTFSFLCYEE